MKPNEVVILNHWKDVLGDYLEPIHLIAQLPGIFKCGEAAFAKVYCLRDNKHEAIKTAISVIVQSDLTLDDVAIAVKNSGHEWLATLIQGDLSDSDVEKAEEKTKRLQEIRGFLTLIVPHIRETIIAFEVAHRFLSENMITQLEFERVESKAKTDGNSIAVIELISSLVRKTTDWLNDFIRILKDLNYGNGLVQSLEDFQSGSEHDISHSHTKVTQYHEESIAHLKAGPAPNIQRAKNAANFHSFRSPASSHPPVDHQLLGLNESHVSESLKAARDENVIVYAPTGHEKATTVAHIIMTCLELKLHQKPKAAFIVSSNDAMDKVGKGVKLILHRSGIQAGYLIEDHTGYMNEVFRSNTVIIMTLQQFRTCVKPLQELDLLIFDECQFCGIDISNFIATHMEKASPIPQVVGLLTTLNIQHLALEQVLDLCANLNAKGGILSLPDKHNYLEFDVLADPITVCLCQAMDEQSELLKQLQIYGCGSDDFHKEHKSSSSILLKDAALISSYTKACIDQMQIFNEALHMYMKDNAKDAVIRHIEKHLPRRSICQSKVESRLIGIAETTMKTLSNHSDVTWYWGKLVAKIKDVFLTDRSSKVIFIVEEQRYIHQIRDRLIGEDALAKIPIPVKALPNDDQHEQTLADFKDGVYGIAVCTSEIAVKVCETVCCSLAICYDSVSGTISKSRLAGRVRQSHTEYGNRFTGSARSHAQLDMMVSLDSIEKVQDMVRNNYSKYKEEILKRQSKNNTFSEMPMQHNSTIKQAISAVEMLAQRGQTSRNLLTGEIHATPIQNNKFASPGKEMTARYNQNVPFAEDIPTRQISDNANGDLPKSSLFEVHCYPCDSHLCSGRDIVTLGTNYICINADFKQKYEVRKFHDGGTEPKQGLHCIKCNSKLGIFAKFKRLNIPQLHPGSLQFKQVGQDVVIKNAKWTKVKIRFEEVDEETVKRVLWQ